jgi:HAE1 family hydrophobic/amphiphilic exporter-1
VFASYPGVGSLEVEALVTEPLEEAVAAVPGLTTLRSTAREGAAVLNLTFAHGTDLLEALGDVRVAVERARDTLPTDLDAPQVFRFDPNQFPILFLSVTSQTLGLREVTRIARDDVKPRLSRVPGVAAIDLRGEFEREVRVELFSSRLLDLGIPIEQVERALVAANLDLSVGKVRDGGREVGLRAVGAKRAAKDLEGIVVAVAGGQLIRLSDVGQVVDDHKERDNVVRVNGQAGLRLGVRKGPGENTIAVAKRTYEAIEQLKKDLPAVEINVIMDQSAYIENAVAGARNAALIGGLLAIAVLLRFVRSNGYGIFAAYRVVLGVGILALLFTRGS